MGGLLILITLTVATLLWADLTNRYVWIVLGVTLTFGAVGFWDDFLKVTKRNPKGVPGKLKLALSVVVAARRRLAASRRSRPRRCATCWRCRSSRTCCCRWASSASCSSPSW